MYYTMGYYEIIKCINKSCGFYDSVYNLTNNKLKQGYYNLLYNRSVFENKINWDGIKMLDFNELLDIAPYFCVNKKKHFDINSIALKNRLSSDFFENALIKIKNQDEALYNLCCFIIKVILINQLKSYTNGTNQDTIGLASMDFKDNFLEQDFIELVIHQLTHMLLFIDNLSANHISNDNKDKMIEIGLKNKLGGTKFSAYLTFHNYIVGVEVLCFRNKSTGLDYEGIYHGSTKRILNVCEQFQKGLLNNIDLFTDRASGIFYKSNILFNGYLEKISNRI